jgi:hypothetical protein
MDSYLTTHPGTKTINGDEVAKLLILPPLRDRSEFGQLLESLGFRVGAEVGVQRGLFSLETLRNWKSCSKFYLIDPWRHQENYDDVANVDDETHEEYMLQTKKRLATYKEKLVFLRMFSSAATEHIADGGLDYVYIDARHDYESVMADLERFLPKVRKGGILAGHDFVDNDFVLSQGDDWSLGPSGRRDDNKAVKSAVLDFVRKYDKQVIVCYAEGSYPSWYFRV